MQKRQAPSATNRAHSILTVKAVDMTSEKRTITGIATTPSPDRMGDIVEPLGIEFKNPMPLLWQHDATRPVGLVKFKKPTKDGIEFEAEILKFDEPPGLKARVDEAWASVVSGLVAGVSIGFRPTEYQWMDDGGIRFVKSEVYELSLVTIPANAEATIATVKSLDAAQPKSGQAGGDKTTKPAVAGRKSISLNVNKPEDQEMKTLAQQIADLQAKRLANATRMEEIVQLSMTENRGTTTEEADEFDGLDGEIKSLDADIKRLQMLENVKKTATAINPVGVNSENAPALRGTQPTVPAAPKLRVAVDKGIRFARLARVKALSAKEFRPMDQIAEALFANRDPEFVSMIKANVIAHSTVDAESGGFLVGEEGSLFADFVEYLRPMTILGRFGQGGMPALRRVPFRVALLGQTTGGDGYWVGEGKPKPLTGFEGERNTLEPLKVANIAVATMELLRDSSPSAEAWLRDQLAAALTARMDIDFITPAKTAVTGISPASITNGAGTVVSTGTTADAVRLDVRALFQKFIDANNAPTSGVWIMSHTNALALSLLINDLGQPEFPGITMMGGTFQGLPVITSQYVGDIVVLVNASDIYFADEGGIDVQMSSEASLQMLDNPTNDSVTPTATSMVSMFQTNSVAFRAERSLNWARRRSSAVSYLSSVNWGGDVPAS